MGFKVSKVKGAPRFDALPVAKIVDYPLEKRDYKPFAQNRICVGERELYVRMWAFEVSPMPSSELRCILYLFPGHSARALSLSVMAPGESGGRNRVEVSLLEHGVQKSGRDALQWSHGFNGEDLQGVYWGETVALPLELAEQLGGERPALQVGDTFLGNFFKLCDTKGFAHKGCYYPADFTGNAYLPASMGRFDVVAY